MTLKSDAKFEEKLTHGSKNDMTNLVNFHASSGKSEDLHFAPNRGCSSLDNNLSVYLFLEFEP